MEQFSDMTRAIRQPQPVLALAPMAGITDRPFRELCQQFGASWTVSEMVSANPDLRQSRKSLTRTNCDHKNGITAIQITGIEPEQMAELAREQADAGAAAIDINMGCPVRKVCRRNAGSALLRDEPKVAAILSAVVGAVSIPVTLKTRLGWDANQVNILAIMALAESSGIAALAIHGRTREQMYHGSVDYAMIAEVKRNSRIPIWVNGDIISPQQARAVLDKTKADGIMIGRAACGQPWLWRDVAHFLAHGDFPERITVEEASNTVLAHLDALYAFYGDRTAVRLARKHLRWYFQALPNGNEACTKINSCHLATAQWASVRSFLAALPEKMDFWPCTWRNEQ